MQILRKIFLILFVPLLLILLPLQAVSWTIGQTVMERTIIKSWLKEGAVYDNIIETVSKIANESMNQSDPNINQQQDKSMPDVSTIATAAKKALPANVLQDNTEQVLDGAYDWLEGKTPTIKLNLNLDDEKKNFLAALQEQGVARTASLPSCPLGTDSTDFDPFTAQCLPANVNSVEATQKIISKLSTDESFFPDTNITGEDLKVDGGQKLFESAFSYIPGNFQLAKKSTLIISVIVAVLSLLIIFLGKTRKTGFKILAWIYGLSAIGPLALALANKSLSNLLVKQVTTNTSDTKDTTQLISPLINVVSNNLLKWQLVFGLIYLGVTIVCIILALVIRKSPKKQAIQSTTESPVGTTKATSNNTGQTAYKSPQTIVAKLPPKQSLADSKNKPAGTSKKPPMIQ